MSCNYAEGLSPYHDKGQLGLEEKFDSKAAVSTKVSTLSKWINEAEHVVVHTGAGISTAAGIPDFRGPKGVWTLEAKGKKPDLSKDFNEAIPTITHMAIMKLVEKEKVKYVVSQNIDGLHLRSNLPRKYLSELHGNMFTEQCNSCNRQFVRSTPVPTVGQKSLNKPCPATKTNGRPCRGRLHDTILDWEHNLPENDLGMADYNSCLADLSICLGTTMQIVPSGNLPLYTKKHGGKLVIVNLQPTKHDRKADLLIHAYVDEVMTMLMKNLNIKIPKYTPKNDPTRTLANLSTKFIEWTILDQTVKKMKKIYEEKCGSKEAKKRLEMIDDEDDMPLNIRTFKRKGKDDEDSDLEVVDVVVKPKKSKDSSKKSSKKKSPPVYNTTITIKKIVPPPSKKSRFEPAEKITIKKNVTSSKTKYEIVTKPKKTPKCEIVYCTDGDVCNDLDMICESDDDEMTNNFTTNFKRYLYEDVKKEIKDTETDKIVEIKEEVKEIKNEVKTEDEVKNDIEEKKCVEEETKKVEVKDKADCDQVIVLDEQKMDVKEIPVEKEKKSIEPIEEDLTKEESNTKNSVPEKLEKEKEFLPVEDGNKNLSTRENEKSLQETNNLVENEVQNKASNCTIVSDQNQDDIVLDDGEKNTGKNSVADHSSSEKEKEKSTATNDSNINPTQCDQIENLYENITSLENSALKNQIQEGQSESSQYDNSLEVTGCNTNSSSVNENFEFYNNQFNFME